MSDFGKLTPLGWLKLIAAIASAVAGVLATIFPEDSDEPATTSTKTK